MADDRPSDGKDVAGGQPPRPADSAGAPLPRGAGNVLRNALILLWWHWRRMLALGVITCLCAVAVAFLLACLAYALRLYWPLAESVVTAPVGVLLAPLWVGYHWCAWRLAEGLGAPSAQLFRAFLAVRLFWRVLVAELIPICPLIFLHIAKTLVMGGNAPVGLTTPFTRDLPWTAAEVGFMALTLPFAWAGLHVVVTRSSAGQGIRRSLGFAWHYPGLFAAYLGTVLVARAANWISDLLCASHVLSIMPQAQESAQPLVPCLFSLLPIVFMVAHVMILTAISIEFYREFVRRDRAASAARAA